MSSCAAEGWTAFGVGAVVTILLLVAAGAWFYRWLVMGR
jgi:hypothetical protein